MKKQYDCIVMGAAGRDFHSFNTLFREDERYQVVAFTATRYELETGSSWTEILSVAPDGSGLRQLTRGHHDGSPVFSPDGSRLAFISDRDEHGAGHPERDVDREVDVVDHADVHDQQIVAHGRAGHEVDGGVEQAHREAQQGGLARPRSARQRHARRSGSVRLDDADTMMARAGTAGSGGLLRRRDAARGG